LLMRARRGGELIEVDEKITLRMAADRLLCE
jgi:hypothetical protein